MTQTSTYTIKNPTEPASEKQQAFLASLLKDRECPGVAEKVRLSNALGFLSKGNASKLIDEALKSPKKAVSAQQMVQDFSKIVADAKAAQAPEIKLELSELPKFGYYQLGETLYYWDCTGKDAAPQLRRLAIVEAYSYSTGTYAKKGSWKKVYAPYGSPKVTGTYEPYNGKGYYKGEKTATVMVPKVLAEAVLAGIKPLTQDEAGKLGKQFGFCVRCGATLTDPVSVANGIGPVCATYWH